MKKDAGLDIIELINKMQERITIIDRKLDTLISKTAQKPVEAKSFQQPGNTQSQGSIRQENGFRERVLHKAICADCKKACEVPFKPSGERPVYCKECFSKRKTHDPFKARPADNRPRVAAPVQTAHVAKPEVVEKKKPAKKKKPAAKRKK